MCPSLFPPDDAMKYLIEKVLEVAKNNQVPTPHTETLNLEDENQFLAEVHALSSLSCCGLDPIFSVVRMNRTRVGLEKNHRVVEFSSRRGGKLGIKATHGTILHFDRPASLCVDAFFAQMMTWGDD